MRFGLAAQATGLQDIRFGEDVLVMGKKFANKLWNISRYVLQNVSEISNFSPFGRSSRQFPISKPETKLDLNKEVLQKLTTIITQTTQNIESYQFAEAANRLYHFIWHDFADKYIEETKDKADPETKATLAYSLVTILKLLHPFMPFITEELYQQLPLPDKKLLLVENWPGATTYESSATATESQS